MMNIKQLNLFLTQTHNMLHESVDKVITLVENLDKCSVNDKITIHDFASKNELSLEQAEIILNTLSDMNILKKTERIYRCSKCGTLLTLLTIWDEGEDMYCYHCDTTHPCADVCDTETVYSLYVEPTLKVFEVTWLDKYEKDSNNNPLPRKASAIAYNQSDVESIIHEYYHYISDSIKVSAGVDIMNKTLVKDYN